MNETHGPAEEPQEGEQPTQDDPKVFDAEYVDKLRKESAKYRTEARANAEAARRLSEIEQSQKSDQQKADDRIKDLEAKFAAAEARALRAEIANAHGISAEDRDLFLTGTDVETLTAQAKRLAERASERKKQNNVVPTEGKNSSPREDSNRAFAKQLFSGD